MHIKLRGMAIALVASCLLAPQIATARTWAKEEFHIEDGVLKRGNGAYTVHAVLTPGLLKPGSGYRHFSSTVCPPAGCGANNMCFDMLGYDEKGENIAQEAQDALKQLHDDVKGWHLSGMCRVLPPGLPTDAKFRRNAIVTAARACKERRRFLYLIDGPDCADLLKRFSKEAPDLVVVAPDGAPITLVTAQDAYPAGKLAMLFGAVPATGADKTNFIIPNTPDMLAKMDQALVKPAERAPWQPDNSILPEELRNEGWIALFDGKSFNGWICTGDINCWRVADGMIQWVKKGGGVLHSHDRYGDFMLHAEWRIEEGGNSGLFLRMPRAGRQSRIGMELQIMGDHGKETGDKMTGALYEAQAPRVNAGNPAGEWNVYEVTLKGKHIKAVLNGQIIHDMDFSDHEKLAGRNLKGFIGLQDHGKAVAFRNIRIKPLD